MYIQVSLPFSISSRIDLDLYFLCLSGSFRVDNKTRVVQKSTENNKDGKIYISVLVILF